MRSTFRRAVQVGAVTIALTATAALTAAPAHANDPVTAGVELGEDTVALGVDSAIDLAAGCVPIVQSWSPEPLTYTPFIRNNSTYYRIVGGGTAHLSCSTAVRIRARLSDVSVPPFPTVVGSYTNTNVTSKNPKDMGSVDVPYVGPDAPILRPAGHITVHVEVFRRLSTGRYAKIPYGCMEWRYVIQPAASLTTTDPSPQGACAYDGAYLVVDTLDGSGQEEIDLGIDPVAEPDIDAAIEAARIEVHRG